MRKLWNIFKSFCAIIGAIVVLGVGFLTIEFIAYYSAALDCGDTKEEAYIYANDIVNELYIEPVNKWLEEQNMKYSKTEVIEFHIPNWNIEWNSLGREP